MKNVSVPSIKANRMSLWIQIKRHLPFYLFLLLPVAQVIIFNYLPMYGVQISFRDFKIKRGITGSEWVGLEHFIKLFSDKTFYNVLKNTIYISSMTLIFTFPLTIVFALMINELRNGKFKRVSQTITYMPHFLSWIIVGSFFKQMLSPTGGAVNMLLVSLGILDDPVYFMIQKQMFVPIYLIATLWKELGWGSIIYLAAMASIDPSLYEAASLDGAGRLRKVMHITFPGILPTVSTLLILRLGSLMSVGFDPIFNLYNSATYEVADVISTYVYRRGLVDAKYDYTTAVGLFQNVVSMILVLSGNWLARKADPDFRIM